MVDRALDFFVSMLVMFAICLGVLFGIAAIAAVVHRLGWFGCLGVAVLILVFAYPRKK